MAISGTNQKSLEQSEKLERWRDSARSSSVIYFVHNQTTFETNEDITSIEKRVRKSITGIIGCNLATEEVFAEGSFNKKVDVLICSLVYDVVCTDVISLETVMKRSLR